MLLRTPRFAERVFTVAERQYCDSRGAVSAQHYAARFAAKEASLKALQTGWRGGISWQDVEVASKENVAHEHRHHLREGERLTHHLARRLLGLR